MLTRAHLLLLLLVPALAVPRGVVMGWCLCPEALAACCTDCCSEDLPGELVFDAGADDDCAGCHSIEVEDFDELQASSPLRLPAPAVALAPPTPPRVAPAAPAAPVRGARAPPVRVTPPGLRPGAAPLRL